MTIFGLQIRCAGLVPSRVGSIPMHFRQAIKWIQWINIIIPAFFINRVISPNSTSSFQQHLLIGLCSKSMRCAMHKGGWKLRFERWCQVHGSSIKSSKYLTFHTYFVNCWGLARRLSGGPDTLHRFLVDSRGLTPFLSFALDREHTICADSHDENRIEMTWMWPSAKWKFPTETDATYSRERNPFPSKIPSR